MKILITGNKGQLGNTFMNLLAEKDEIRGVDISDLDITDKESIQKLIRSFSPNLILHCAAYTNVDLAETDRNKAYNVNVAATGYISEIANELNSCVVYISTDYIFDGLKNEAYIEVDKANPLNYYGLTKYQGEQVIAKTCEKHFIIRTSWLYSKTGNNFVNTMLRIGKSTNPLNVVSDQVGTPTYVPDLASAIYSLIQTKEYGTYNISNSGYTSWFEFAGKIFEYCGLEKDIKPITSQQLNRPAKRPHYSVLNSDKLYSKTNIRLRDWKLALRDCLDKNSLVSKRYFENKE